MQEIKCRVALVGLDLTAMDDTILDFLPGVLNALPLERILFAHFQKRPELPQEIIDEFPDVMQPGENDFDDLRSKVDAAMQGVDVEYELEVQEEEPLLGMLKLASLKNVDVIIMGRKRHLDGSGFLSGSLVRKSPATMLLVPENPPLKLEKLLIPTDFSDHSARALRWGRVIEKRAGAEVSLVNFFHVPSGYSKAGKTYDEFAQLLEYHAGIEYERFMKRHHMEEARDCEYLLVKDQSMTRQFSEHAHDINADMVLIASKGRTDTSALLLGSMAEKLILEIADIPIIIIQSKEEHLTFFEALLRI